MIIDSHCHLDYEPMYSDLNGVIKRANNSKVKSALDWLMFLDLELSINSNFTTLLIDLPLSLSLSILKRESRKIFVDGKYFISEILTLDSAHIADIICKSSGD